MDSAFPLKIFSSPPACTLFFAAMNHFFACRSGFFEWANHMTSGFLELVNRVTSVFFEWTNRLTSGFLEWTNRVTSSFLNWPTPCTRSSPSGAFPRIRIPPLSRGFSNTNTTEPRSSAPFFVSKRTVFCALLFYSSFPILNEDAFLRPFPSSR